MTDSGGDEEIDRIRAASAGRWGRIRLAILMGLWIFSSHVPSAPATESQAPSAQVADPPEDLLATQQQLQSILPAVQRATVVVRSGPRRGSGVFIEKQLVATALHVVGRGASIRIVFAKGNGKTGAAVGKLVYSNKQHDFALIRVTPAGSHVPLKRFSQPVVGVRCFALGYTDGRPTAYLRAGRIRAVTADNVLTSCELGAGDSGGPLFLSDGTLVGIHRQRGRTAGQNRHLSVRRMEKLLRDYRE